jgi:hypothetical protein
MPRGGPDWDEPDYGEAVERFDSGELAFMLTHFQRLDGRGRPMWLDTFDNGAKAWEVATAGNGVAPVVNNAYPYLGGVSLKLDSGTLAGVGSSLIRTRNFIMTGKRVGFEYMLRYASGTGRIVTNIYWLTSTVQKRGRLTIRPEDGEILVGADTALTSVGNVGAGGAIAIWLPVKFVVDFATLKLVRVMVGPQSIDLSDFDMISTTLTGNYQVLFEIGSNAWGAGNKTTYLGYALITQEEP